MSKKQSHAIGGSLRLMVILLSSTIFLSLAAPAYAKTYSVSNVSSTSKHVVAQYKKNLKKVSGKKSNSCLKSEATKLSKSSAQKRKWQKLTNSTVSSKCGVKNVRIVKLYTPKKQNSKKATLKKLNKNSTYKKIKKSKGNLYGVKTYREKKSKRTWTVFIAAELSVPTAPKNVEVTGVTDVTADVSWSSVSQAVRYIVEVQSDIPQRTITKKVTVPRSSLESLSEDTTYTVRVYAENNVGTRSGASIARQFKTSRKHTEPDTEECLMTPTSKIGFTIIVPILALGLAACEEQEPPVDNPPITQPEIEPTPTPTPTPEPSPSPEPEPTPEPTPEPELPPVASAPDGAVVFDSFSRDVAMGWGTADAGGAWQTSASQHFSVNETGNISLNKGQGALISFNKELKNSETTFDVSLSETPAGGSTFLEMRPKQISNNTHYALKLVAANNGTVRADTVKTVNGTATTLGQKLVPNVTLDNGAIISAKMIVDEGEVKVKVWQKGDEEPTAWFTEASDDSVLSSESAAMAVYGYLSGSAATSQVIQFDNIGVVELEANEEPPVVEPPVVERVNAPAHLLDATNTGVIPGTVLTLHNGDMKITTAGTVIQNMDIKGTVKIEANNVTIKNSRIRGQGSTKIGIVNVKSGVTGTKIVDTEIFNEIPHPDTNGIMGGNFTLERVNIHTVVDQVHVTTAGNVKILHSWLHSNTHFVNDPNWNGGPSHDDNVQLIGADNVIIKSSRLEGSKNAAIMVGQNQSKVTNLIIDGNLIGGGACSINISPKGFGDMINNGNVISNNVFQRNQTKHLGCAVISADASLPTMINNTWEDTGETVVRTRG